MKVSRAIEDIFHARIKIQKAKTAKSNSFHPYSVLTTILNDPDSRINLKILIISDISFVISHNSQLLLL